MGKFLEFLLAIVTKLTSKDFKPFEGMVQFHTHIGNNSTSYDNSKNTLTLNFNEYKKELKELLPGAIHEEELTLLEGTQLENSKISILIIKFPKTMN